MTTSLQAPSENSKSEPWRRWLRSGAGHPATYLALSVGILMLDLFTGPYLQFPILFVVPVALSAWFVGPRIAYAQAILLPVGRLLIAEWVDSQSPFIYTLVNCLVRIAVITFIAYLVRRVARQTRELEARIADLVTICAWSRTVEYEGEWISFEQYLLRRFKIVASHGISPEQAAKLRASVPPPAGRQQTPGPERPPNS